MFSETTATGRCSNTSVHSNKRGNRADNTRGAFQRPRQNATRFDRRPERATPNLRAKRLEQRLARLRDAARDHHDVRVEDVEQVRDARA
jgi:hypothetical protein